MDEKFEYCTCIFEVLALEEFFFVTRRCSQALLTAQSEGRHRTRFYMVRCMKYKIAKIAKVTGKCPACEEYAEINTTNPSKIAVMACKGACAKGEVARRAANLVAHHLARDETLRIRLAMRSRRIPARGILSGGRKRRLRLRAALSRVRHG